MSEVTALSAGEEKKSRVSGSRSYIWKPHPAVVDSEPFQVK
jgi:hypothetical protein